jgi:crotonobetainyl-CoA:carnitine CoA-transferase CaiB-like acyl-CoA transferase
MKLRDVLPLPRPPAPPPTIADAEVCCITLAQTPLKNLQEILGLFEAVTRVRRFARRPSDAANERWLDDVVRRWISSHTPEDVGAYFAEIQIQTQQEKHPTPRRASARDQGERFSAAHIEEKDSFRQTDCQFVIALGLTIVKP